MEYGERVLQKHLEGDDVVELQIRLAGFRGTLPDGEFGPGTELQVTTFQRDYMKMETPTGIVDRKTMEKIDEFADKFPVDFNKMKCPCGVCPGFGRGKFKGLFVTGRPKLEAFHRYEYPGIHRMILWAVRALFFYMPEHSFQFNSSYRCSVDNLKHGRHSTNHHGKAVDVDVPRKPGESKEDDMEKCDGIRGKLVETANAQVGWDGTNRKSLEPRNIAPTWVHYDVRQYERKYLDDKYFVTTTKDLNNRKPIKI